MGDYKSLIHSETIAEQKRKYGDLPLRDYRRAIVIGSNGNDNIGAGIAHKLRSHSDSTISSVVECEEDPGLIDECINDPRHYMDVLICCAAENYMGWIEDIPLEEMEQVIYNSLICPMEYARLFARSQMIYPFRKHIVFIGSMAYTKVLNASSPYCAAKAGLAHFAKCIAWELAPKGFDVYCVHPSNVAGTPMTKATIEGIMRYRDLDRPAAEAYWGSVNPKEHWLTVDEIAETVLWLTSGKACHLSGANIEMNGGAR